jgi:hypothetical protein
MDGWTEEGSTEAKGRPGREKTVKHAAAPWSPAHAIPKQPSVGGVGLQYIGYAIHSIPSVPPVSWLRQLEPEFAEVNSSGWCFSR